MRTDAGGLICVAIHPVAAKKLGLPFMHDVLKIASEKIPSLVSISNYDIKYDSRSSFSIWVNHRDTFTGITDVDRAKTIRRIGEVVDIVMMNGYVDFGKEFRSPGHVAVLRASEKLVYERVGQTELSVALAEIAGIAPAVAICEMLDSETGRALSKEKAMKYAEEKGFPFVEGKEIVKYYKEFREIKAKIFL
jgi:3,4-dihydroxy 2-butanone 4-phosphate synthase